MTTPRQHCLFVLSSAIEGVSAQSFIQAYTLAQTAFTVQLASPNAKPTEFVHQDENSRRWLNDFRSKPYSIPLALESVEEPICAIGMGVAGLCCAKTDNVYKNWTFRDFSMTSTSVFELAKTSSFSTLSLVPEDFIKDNLAQYSCSLPGEVHIVVDRFLVTAQNETSTLIAVQNLILLSNHGSQR